MKIFVPIKRVPDYEIKVKVTSSGDGIQMDGVRWVLNPFDEIAVEEALKLREQFSGVEVVVVTVGPAAASEQLRTAIAMGADHGIIVITDQAVDSFVAHQALAEVYKRGEYGIIIMGKQAVDSDANQTGQLLAAALDLPQATFASKLVIENEWKTALVTREVDGGLETLRVSLPAVVTTDLRLNTPRLAPLPGIVKARKKQLEEIPLESLGIVARPAVVVKKLSLPPPRKGGGRVSSVQELVDKLHTESKVI